MKNTVKKIIAASLLSASALTAIGCGTNGNKLAKNIDKSMAEFVSSINNLDYVESGKQTNENIGKIVETSVTPYAARPIKTITSEDNQIKFLSDNVSEAEIENTITKPADRKGDFKLFVLSESPYVSLSSSDNKASLTLNVNFSTDKIESTSSEIDEKINKLILKRSILMIYVNEIYNGNVNLSEENKTAINAYVNVIKENTSFLNGNRGMVKNQLKLASDLVEDGSNGNLVNYYIIKSGEALETRASKLDSGISAIDAITKIIEDNLTESSPYYKSKLSKTYESIINRTENKTENGQNQNNIHAEIANSISESLNFFGHEKASLDDTQKAETKPAENMSENKVLNLNSTNKNNQMQQTSHQAVKDTKDIKSKDQLNNKGMMTQNIKTLELQNSENEDENFSRDPMIQPRLKQNNKIIYRNGKNRRFSGNSQKNMQNNTINGSNLQNLNRVNKDESFGQKPNYDDIISPHENLNKGLNKLMQHIPSNEESKTIRAERTPERVTSEEYTSTSTSSTYENENNIVAENVPFKSSSTHKIR